MTIANRRFRTWDASNPEDQATTRRMPNVGPECLEDDPGGGKPFGSTGEVVWSGPAGEAGTSYHVEFKNDQVILWKLTRPNKTLDPGKTYGNMTGDKRTVQSIVSGLNDKNKQFWEPRKDRR